MSRPSLIRFDAGDLALLRFERAHEGSHYALIQTPSAGSDVQAVLQEAAVGRPWRRTGLAGAVLRVHPDRPDLMRLDWRPGRTVGPDEALERLRALFHGLDRAPLLRAAGALDAGIAILSPAARRGEWATGASHHPDTLPDALVAALTGRYPRGAFARLGRETHAVPDASCMRPGQVHVSPVLHAALSDAVAVSEEGGVLRLLSAERPAFRRPEPRLLLDADLPEAILGEPLDGLPIPPVLAKDLARLGLARVGAILGLPLHRVLRPGLTQGRIETLRAAIDDLAVVRTPVARAGGVATIPSRPARSGGDAPAPTADPTNGPRQLLLELPVPVARTAPIPGPVAAPPGAALPRMEPALPLLDALLDAMPERHRAMLRAFAGYGGTALAMHEAAAIGGYATERVRQIAARLYEQFLSDPRGRAVLERLVEAMAETPIRLERLATEAWAEGMTLGTVDFLVRRLPGHGLRVTVDDETGEVLVTPMSTSGWNAAIRGGRVALSRLRPGLDRKAMALAVMQTLIGLPEPYQACVISRLLPPGFVPPVPGTRIVLEAILSDARRPMTFEEIADAYAGLCGRDASWSQLTHALYAIAVRDEDRRYSLTVVFGEDLRLAAIAEGCHAIIRKGGGRHWTLDELRAALPGKHGPVLGALGDRGLDAVLRADTRFLRRKKGHWLLRAGSNRDRRPHVDAWAEAILVEAGVPMPAPALIEEIVRTRGALVFPLLKEHGRMVRVDQGVWGLHDRDLGLDRDAVERIQAAAADALDPGPMPLRELHASLSGLLPPTVGAPALQSLLKLCRDGVRVGRHGVAYLSRDRGPPTGKLQKAIVAVARDGNCVEDVIRMVRRDLARTPSYKFVMTTAKRAGIRLERQGR